MLKAKEFILNALEPVMINVICPVASGKVPPNSPQTSLFESIVILLKTIVSPTITCKVNELLLLLARHLMKALLRVKESLDLIVIPEHVLFEVVLPI